jgi:Nuclease A inhibitor-like protein
MATSSTNILKALRAASKGLVYLSESDKPVKAFLWAKSEANIETLALLKSQLEIPEGTEIETRTLERFSTNQSPDFNELTKTLTEHLTDINVFVYRNGTYKEAYVVGKTPEGDWSGVSTRLTET